MIIDGDKVIKSLEEEPNPVKTILKKRIRKIKYGNKGFCNKKRNKNYK